ncbi:hypothetical protein GCM10010294_21460 [Streptomyces griseoloalbus]|nr:hypothetical protein GCM10010294_21460 [Streptomyces griseoloalbus]
MFLAHGSGETHDDRGLKNRPAEEVRLVPIPPQLVTIPRQHVDTFGTAEDGRAFTNERGGVVHRRTAGDCQPQDRGAVARVRVIPYGARLRAPGLVRGLSPFKG